MGKKEMDCRAFHKHKSIVMLVVGILIILNALYGLLSWGVFVGGIIALLGLIGIVHSKVK
jgi:hypothetical protein